MESITIKNKGMKRVSVQSPRLPDGFLRIEAGETVTVEVKDGVSGLLTSLSGKPGISIVNMKAEIPPVPMPAGLPAEADTGPEHIPEDDKNKTDSEDYDEV